MNDPVNQLGNWNSNSTFAAVHTQSTRTSNNPFNNYGAGGGLDDRFDFIFVSSNLLNSSNDVSYMSNSYQTYGNNGNCFNANLSDSSCSGPYAQATRNLLWNMSDHLPLVMDIQLNQDFLNATSFHTQELVTFPYGNVVNSSLSLKINEGYVNKIKFVELYNALGQLLVRQSITTKFVTVDVSSFGSGIYYLKPQIGRAEKFIIIH